MDDIFVLVLMLVGTVSLPVLVSLFGVVTMDELGMCPSDAPRIYLRMIVRLIIAGVVSIGALVIVMAVFVK